jgi:hypothetical protein
MIKYNLVKIKEEVCRVLETPNLSNGEEQVLRRLYEFVSVLLLNKMDVSNGVTIIKYSNRY